jgi:hypothetical protein
MHVPETTVSVPKIKTSYTVENATAVRVRNRSEGGQCLANSAALNSLARNQAAVIITNTTRLAGGSGVIIFFKPPCLQTCHGMGPWRTTMALNMTHDEIVRATK